MAAAIVSSAGLPLFPKGKADTTESAPPSAAQNEKKAEREPVFTYIDGSVQTTGKTNFPQIRWYIYYGSTFNFTVYRGPFRNKKKTLSVWMQEKLPVGNQYYIGMNGILVTDNPYTSFSREVGQIEAEYSAGGSVDESGEFTDESVTDEELLAISSESGNNRQKIQERLEQLASQPGEKAKEKPADRTAEPAPENAPAGEEADSAEKTEDEPAEAAASPALTDSARNSRGGRTDSDYLQDYIKPAPDALPPEKLPEREISVTDETDADGVTGLMRAAKTGNDWKIRVLLGAGAEINAKDKNGWTALMYASRWQENLNTVSLLVSAGSDVKAEDQFGTDALVLAACWNGNPDILRKLLEFYGAADRQVMRALTLVLSGTDTQEFTGTEKVRVFMEKGVPLNIYLDGRTPLMYAAKYGKSAEILEILVENNAAAGLRSAEGKTAFDYAMENPRLDTEEVHRILNR